MSEDVGRAFTVSVDDAGRTICTFTALVEPPEPMCGLHVPEGVREALGGPARPPLVVDVNGEVWRTRLALLKGRALIGFSLGHRAAAGVATGDLATVTVRVDDEERTAEVPSDLAAALGASPAAAAAFAGKTVSQRRQLIRGVESAKQAATRQKRIEQLLASLVS